MLTKWNPFREMQMFEDRINKVFSDFFRKDWPSPILSNTWVPAVDIINNDEDIVVRAELPGMKKEDIELEISDNTLHLKGERKQERKEKGDDYYVSEINYGSFHRAFTLPSGVDTEKVKAEYKDGILEIVLPKQESVKAKRIPITS